MFVYRNANTGDEVERAERSPRLDALPNWTLIAEPEPAEQTPPPVPARTPMGPDDPAPPARNGSTEVWRAYAVARGMDPGEAATRTRDDLVAEYLGGG